ncbi:MAG: hypothetical protein M3441_10640 [Chloroflexota bacterium]|nr:hypothetical protein [Chloroflexota bacterium]
MFDLKLEPRAAYCGLEVPSSYFSVNGRNFDLPRAASPYGQHVRHKLLDLALHRRVKRASLAYTLFAGDEDLESLVKVIPLPVHLPKALRKGAMLEMQWLRDQGVLTQLRGGRLTDLARPLSPEARSVVTGQCPRLVELIRMVEEAIAGSDLFVRALKIDEARASTTGVGADKSQTNLHFDAELTTLADYPGPIYQYFVNIALLPRQFRIVPLPIAEMVRLLVARQLMPAHEQHAWTPKALVETFTKHFNAPLEEIIIEPGSLAIFNGRVFAHDAGKGRISALARGRFVPTSEPDFIIALDTVKTGYHEGYYFPEQSILEDEGTEAWWNLLGGSANTR